MRAAIPRLRKLLTIALVLAAFALVGGRAAAQVAPNWDHYLVYEAQPKSTLTVPLVLVDQFQQTLTNTEFLDRFANPVQKDHEGVIFPINFPELHYSWWKLTEQPYDISVIASNQFGDHPLRLGALTYLLNPAFKTPGPLPAFPLANHYTVYQCTGDALTAALVLTDQFYTRTSLTLVPRYFCTPVEKRTPDGLVYPIIDPAQHYVVYEIELDAVFFTAMITDQFVADLPIDMFDDRFLMVPTIKHLPPTEAKSSTWGRLKQLFR